MHGTQDLANVLVRNGVPFHFVTSHPSDAGGLRELFDYFAAAAAVARLRICRLGLMGYPFPGMGDIAFDSTHLAATLGCRWTVAAAGNVSPGAAAAPADAVERLKDEYRRCYAIAEDVGDADLDAAARAEWSLRSIAADQRLDALSFQFLAFGEDQRTVTLPFVAVEPHDGRRHRLCRRGRPDRRDRHVVVAPSLSTRLVSARFFTIDFAGNGLLLSHMGEANVAMARTDRPVPLVARPVTVVRTLGRQLALVTTFEPRPATLCCVGLGPQSRWRLIVSRMEIEDFGPLPGMPVPHCKVVNRADVRNWLTAYARAGGPHHHAICFGDARPRLKLTAALLDADYCEV